MYIPSDHYLVKIIKKEQYKDTLEKLSALRNFAAHGSHFSKRAALQAVGQQRLGSSGSWLKRQNRFKKLLNDLQDLAIDIINDAPY